eukprot:11185405-Heterocapsa_arctica.AAC.1
MIPRNVYDQGLEGQSHDAYQDLRQEIANHLSNRRPTFQIASSRDAVPRNIDVLQETTKNTSSKGKCKGKWKQGERPSWEAHAEPHSKEEGKGKEGGKTSKGGKGSKGRGIVCYNCGGKGHMART